MWLLSEYFFFVDRIALLRRAVIQANEQPKKKRIKMHKIVCAMESKNVRTIGAREVVKNNQNQKMHCIGDILY